MIEGSFLPPGLRLEVLPEADSTNRIAMEAARDGASEGLVVLAERQWAGRGRQGRSWLSHGAGSLTVSFLRRPALPAADAWAYTLVAGLAAHGLAPGSWIKWPNDLFIGARKAGGVLCELSTQGMSVEAVVVGVGLNLAAPHGGWASELADKATALDALDPTLADRQHTLGLLSAGLLRWEARLLADGPAPLVEAMALAMAPMIGLRVEVERGSGVCAATVLGIGQDGGLRLEDERGVRWDARAGDVHLLGGLHAAGD